MTLTGDTALSNNSKHDSTSRSAMVDDIESKSSFRFCFTLDTEPDNLWKYKDECSFDSFRHLYGFHKKLVEIGARPTYLTTSEVVESALGRSVLEECLGTGSCEIGAHFHSWTRKWPFDVPNLRVPPTMAMAHRLGTDIEERMLAYTCDAIFKALGIEARTYRGGRWSFGPDTPKALSKCGIRVDSTMTPGLSWRDNTNSLTDGPDFRNTPMYPHYLASDESIQNSLLELPVGTAPFPYCGRGFFKSQLIQGIMRAISKRAGISIGYHVLRPTDSTTKTMLAIMNSLMRRGCAVWVFMIHSSELIPCKLLPTQEAVSSMVDRCLEAINMAINLGAEPATLSEAAQWVRSNNLLRSYEK
jgi:hypothetical protein